MAEAECKSEGPAIGIDLGTTFSCVAVVRHGKVEIIANEQGNSTTPSFVAFNQHERLIGEAAKDELAENSENTVFDAKRLIGRKFNDPIVQKEMLQWPFKLVEVNEMPKIEITYRNEVKRFSAEEISAMVLGKMKEVAEAYLNEPVTNAVVTVPAYFNDMQRKSTKDAGQIAGLNVTRIINEPTAAAIAYGMKNDTKIAKNILVFDLGGGTFDVSILNICENVLEVKATGGDTHLGGEDFDNRMMEVFVGEFMRKNNIDISGNKRALRRLRTACERAKRTLSSTKHATIQIDSLAGGKDFYTNLSRARFDDMCANLFRMTIKIVEGALKDADLKCEELDTIVLIGGSSRIPKIQQLLQELFVGKEIEICKTMNPDEAVAYGAAVQAAVIHGGATAEMENMKLTEVTPLTLGVATGADLEALITSPMIKRNTPIPASNRKIFRTIVDNQAKMEFPIIQGERHFARDNFQIGNLTIEGIPAGPAGSEAATVIFSIDENGILTVMAASHSNQAARGELVIKNVCGSLTAAEIDHMIADAEIYRGQDREAKMYYTAREELEQYCIDIKEECGGGMEESVVADKCNEVISRLNNCYRPAISQFQQWRDELETLVLPSTAKKCKIEEDYYEEEYVDEYVEVILQNEEDMIEETVE